MKQYEFVQYIPNKADIKDGIYNGLYNFEPAIIRMKDNIPVYVTFIGWLDADGESQGNSIFHPSGIMASSVQLLMQLNLLP